MKSTEAFVKIWGKVFIDKLVKSGIRGNIVKWLDNYFTDRKIQVRLAWPFFSGNGLSAGTPQGAVCSPLVFNLMLADLPKLEKIEQSIYADDITVVCTEQSILTY